MDKIDRIYADRWARSIVALMAYLFLVLAALLPDKDSVLFLTVMVGIDLLGLSLIGRVLFLAFSKSTAAGRTCRLLDATSRSTLRGVGYFLLLLAILGPDTPGVWALYVLIGTAVLSFAVALFMRFKRRGCARRPE